MLFFPIIIVFSKTDVEYRKKTQASLTKLTFKLKSMNSGRLPFTYRPKLKFCNVFEFYFDCSLSIATLRVFERLMRASKQTTHELLPKPFHIALRLLAVFDWWFFKVIFAFAHRQNIYNAIVKMKVQRIHCVFLFKCVMMFTLLTINELSLSSSQILLVFVSFSLCLLNNIEKKHKLEELDGKKNFNW